ncbi:MAG: RluA family pseudouridine synthase [Clostridia bacterium]|nr:RluA family pseudouridine synthase [Clostridia bacterium]MBQ2237595.1 RluA family pseudouridine synthase [Clostridia bacterium]
MQKINLTFLGEGKKRLDVFIAENTEISRTRAQGLINDGMVTVNGKTADKNCKLKNNDEIAVEIPKPREYTAKPQNIPLDIAYEDEDLLVVNKPKDMVVHPAAGNYEGTLVNALLWHCGDSLSGINGVMRPGILHRIDKNTSGLLIVAKNDFAHEKLAEQIKEHSFTREYEAVVYGRLKTDEGTVNAPIGRHPVRRKEMAVTDKNSREAITHYKVISQFDGFSHIRLKLETGRTHQIRVHMAYLGHPVAGDDVYGPKKVIKSLGGQCLHAKKIGFIHPRSNKYLEFESELPKYFLQFLEGISK